MDYTTHELLGSAIVAVGTALFEVGKAGYGYYEETKATDEYNANMTLANAQNTADARDAGRQSVYAANLAKLTGAIDMDKAKRYLIIGAAIGVPLIAGLVLSKRKG